MRIKKYYYYLSWIFVSDAPDESHKCVHVNFVCLFFASLWDLFVRIIK